MSWSYIARQPILKANRNIYGFELLFRDGEENAFPGVSDEEATSRLIVEQQFDGDIRNLVGNDVAFINFSRKSLIDEHPKLLPSKGVVVEVLETVAPDAKIIAVCEDLKACGYSLALDDYDFNPAWHPWVQLFDIVKIDISQFTRDDLASHISRSNFQSARLLAERVETESDFNDCRSMGFSLFQGYFFARPQMIRKQAMEANSVAVMRLLALTSNSSVDYDELEAVISLDPGLSFKLLRFLNSVHFAVGSRISNLRQALVYLGHMEIRKFVAVVSLTSLGGVNQKAAMSMATTRANFCDALAGKINDEKFRHSAFLVGLFSMIDILLEDSMENILNLLPVDDSIRDALLEDQGIGAEFLRLTECFERADWAGVAAGCKRIGVSEEEINGLYQNAVRSGSRLISSASEGDQA